ncbi:MAG: leucyl aminopeptidase [Deltaproteobacteria bacterium]|nr:leucyl aminopeptidase [Deltaproteobacteria bacterium]
MLTVRLAAGDPTRARVDLLAVAVTRDALNAVLRPFAHAAGRRLGAELARRRFTAAEGSSLLLAGGGRLVAEHLLVIGLGASAPVRAEAWRRAADQVLGRAREVRGRTAALVLARPPADAPVAVEVLVESAILAAYAFTEYRRDPERVALRTLTLFGAGAGDAACVAALRRATILARATNEVRTWINTPATVLTPAALAAEAERIAAASGLAVEIDGRDGIAALGMGALLAVARGSAEEPRFIRLTHRPAAPTRRRLALVGKGITFDSGGLSLKTSDGMEHMKRDMAGGAAVIGAMRAIAALRPDVEVRAYVPASENMPGGSAMKPGDVVRTAAGKTIEVVNTDAEGRLVLADALAIAVRDAPDAIVDIATLTGAVRTALGTRIGAVLGNDPALVRALLDAGTASGERLWQLPLVAAYRRDLDSSVADLRNVADDGYGGTIHAALVLQEFVGGCSWAHLDIAGVAFTERELPCTPRGAVGFGVRLLTRYVLAAAGAAPASTVTNEQRQRAGSGAAGVRTGPDRKRSLSARKRRSYHS